MRRLVLKFDACAFDTGNQTKLLQWDKINRPSLHCLGMTALRQIERLPTISPGRVMYSQTHLRRLMSASRTGHSKHVFSGQIVCNYSIDVCVLQAL